MNSQYPILTILNACPIRSSRTSTKSLNESSSENSESDGSPSIIVETGVDDDIEDLREMVTQDYDDMVELHVGDNNGLHIQSDPVFTEENYELL